MDADMNQFAADLLQSVREMKADVRASETKVPVSQVLAARNKTGLSQQQFANILHISKRNCRTGNKAARNLPVPHKP